MTRSRAVARIADLTWYILPYRKLSSNLRLLLNSISRCS